MKRMVLVFCLTFVCCNVHTQDVSPKPVTLTALLKKASCPNVTHIPGTPVHALTSSCPTPPITIRGTHCKAEDLEKLKILEAEQQNILKAEEKKYKKLKKLVVEDDGLIFGEMEFKIEEE